MADKEIKIKKMKQEVIWYHVFYTLDDLYSNNYFDDKNFNKMLYDLLGYVETKICPPDDYEEIVDRYVTVEYEDIE